MEYPQDIIDAAKNALAPIMSPDLASGYEIRLVAKAIMDERERCATIADHRAALARTLTATAGLALLEALPDAIRATPVNERKGR